MQFDPNNKIIQLCAEGMAMEGAGRPDAALQLFLQAWEEAASDFEKMTAAHYVARHQKSISDKLKWDETALQLALTSDNKAAKEALPSLYLNVAKGYEDLNDPALARQHYDAALQYAHLLPQNGYGNMIKRGIMNGMERVARLAIFFLFFCLAWSFRSIISSAPSPFLVFFSTP